MLFFLNVNCKAVKLLDKKFNFGSWLHSVKSEVRGEINLIFDPFRFGFPIISLTLVVRNTQQRWIGPVGPSRPVALAGDPDFRANGLRARPTISGRLVHRREEVSTVLQSLVLKMISVIPFLNFLSHHNNCRDGPILGQPPPPQNRGSVRVRFYCIFIDKLFSRAFGPDAPEKKKKKTGGGGISPLFPSALNFIALLLINLFRAFGPDATQK